MKDQVDDIIPQVNARKERVGSWLDPDKGTTALACLLGALITANLDWGKVLAGDKAEVSKIIGAVVIVAYGHLTNRLPTIKP